MYTLSTAYRGGVTGGRGKGASIARRRTIALLRRIRWSSLADRLRHEGVPRRGTRTKRIEIGIHGRHLLHNQRIHNRIQPGVWIAQTRQLDRGQHRAGREHHWRERGEDVIVGESRSRAWR